MAKGRNQTSMRKICFQDGIFSPPKKGFGSNVCGMFKVSRHTCCCSLSQWLNMARLQSRDGALESLRLPVAVLTSSRPLSTQLQFRLTLAALPAVRMLLLLRPATQRGHWTGLTAEGRTGPGVLPTCILWLGQQDGVGCRQTENGWLSILK